MVHFVVGRHEQQSSEKPETLYNQRAFHSTKIQVWNFGSSTCPMAVVNGMVHSGCTDPTQATARLVIILVSRIKKKSGTGDNNFVKWKVISVRPTEITGPVKVSHLQSWSWTFRSDQTEMIRSIWRFNWNFRNFGLNEKCPKSLAPWGQIRKIKKYICQGTCWRSEVNDYLL